MRQFFTFILILFLLPLLSAQSKDAVTTNPEELIGSWTIDLRPAPDAQGYFQPFAVEKVEGNTFIGTFYGSPVRDAFINKNWDKLYFAFTTSDASNDYYHSGYLLEGKLVGMSYCPNREFTAPWTAEKE